MNVFIKPAARSMFGPAILTKLWGAPGNSSNRIFPPASRYEAANESSRLASSHCGSLTALSQALERAACNRGRGFVGDRKHAADVDFAEDVSVFARSVARPIE